ncbi:MAG: glycoside hydrolase family 16 [Herbinix sp.]|jgi:beta-glucanase (GH16 family)|nr:glycoside hydrolase family 16 [Herbinix sp.]
MKGKSSLKKLISYLMILAMVLISLSNAVPKQVNAAVDSNEWAATYLNATKIYLHLGNKETGTYNFNINESAKTKGATYLWYVKMDKGNPECVTINTRSGVVTANKLGTAYIRCKVTLVDGTILRPEAKVVVRNNITEVDISNLPKNRTITAGIDTDFNRIILNTEAGKGKASSGITRWEVDRDTAGVEKATDTGVVSPTKVGDFRIRAVSFQSVEKYKLWLDNKILNIKYITATSSWYTITVEAPTASITPTPSPEPTTGGGNPYTPQPVKVSTITIASAGNINTVVSGGTLQLNAIISPANADDQTIVWSVITLSGGKATINSTTGLLTATGIGTVKVTATNVASGVIGTKEITIVVDEEPGNTELWTKVWSDEFDGIGENLDTNGLDLSKWGYQNGTGAEFGLDGWGNNEQQYYSKNNINVKDGNLVITPKLETLGGKKYTSGRIWTSPTFSKKYGRFEARIKLPAGNGFWPAFWMMPKDDVYGGWAASGEMDIMEAKGRILQEVGGTIHYGGAWPNNKYSGASYNFDEGQSITDFHTYAVEWEPGEIRWYVDDKLYQTQNNWSTNGTNGEEKLAFPAPYDQPFYIILNLAVGGNYDGGREPDASVFASNPKMEVDYVRVYELTGRPYKIPADPQIVTEPLPDGARVADSTGNLVYDVNYEQGIIDNREGLDANFGNGWNLIYNEQFGGVASATVEAVDERNYAKINVLNVGTQPYSVQLEQHTTLGRGRWYEFSFDAKAGTSRTLNAKLGGGPDRGWTAYSDSYTFALTNQLQSYKKVFQMTAASDIKTRIEFNCATASGPVWIGNVRLVEVAPPLVEYNASKEALPVSGNLVYNGTFDKYTVDRLAYWNLILNSGASASMFVPEAARELTVNILNPGTQASDITVDQRGIQLYQDNQYTLTFKARSAEDRSISVKLLSKDGTTTIAEKDFYLTTMPGTFEMSFTMANSTDLESKLSFMLGGSNSDVYIDDVRLIKTTIDYTGVIFYPLKNGSFDNDYLSWDTILDSGGAAAFSAVNGEAKIDITNLGQNPWSVMLLQGGMPFTKGLEYTLSFRAKASANRNMEVVLENASYTRAFDSNALQLSTDWKIFNFTIKPSVSENLDLKYLMGKVDNTAVAGVVFIDDVILQVKNPPVLQAPMIIADSTDNNVGNAVDISFQDNEQWRAAIKTVKINGQTIAADKYTVAAGNINFAIDNFTEARNYIILVQAEGYDVTSVVQAVGANDNKIIHNGTFDINTDGWSTYIGDDSNAAISSVNGEMKADFTNYDGWFRWSTQVYQAGIRLEAGKTYRLKFDASSSIAKNILVQIDKSSVGTHAVAPEIALTTEKQTFTFEFTMAETDANAKLNFLLGSNNVPGENFVQHSIYLDNISIEEKSVNPPSENTSIVQNGTFDADINPWTNWSDGGISVVAVSGAAIINLNGFGTDPWSVQFTQSGFNFEPNVTYHLTFRAKASVPRSFGLDIEGAGYYRYMDKGDNLTTEMQTYSYDFTVTKSEPTKLNFFFGKTGSDITDEMRSTPNTIYIDDVIITKVVEGGGTTDPSLITVEAESAVIFAEGANPIGVVEGTAVKAVAPTYIEFTVVIPEAGTYKVTYTGKCSPAGVYYELRDSAGTPIAGIGGGPSDDWTMNHHNAILSAGTHTLRVFIAPGAGSITYLDNVIFELQ